MRPFLRVQRSIILLVVIGLSRCASADDEVRYPSAKDEAVVDVEPLIEQLGHAQYTIRQQAGAKLLALGFDARPALVASLNSLDLEIRLQARRILTSIDEQAFLGRLEAFVAGDAPVDAREFPAWPQFIELTGADPTSRRLFVEMQKSEHRLLKVYAETPPKAGAELWSRCDQIQRSRNLQPVYRITLSPGRIAALLLVASDEAVQGRGKSAAYLNTFCNQEPVRRGLHGEFHRPLREVLGAWIRSADAHSTYHALRLSMRFNLVDGLAPAEKILVNHAQNQKNVLQYALLTIGKLGDFRHIPLVEGFLEEETRCAVHTVRGVNYRTEVRDIALACLFHLAEVNPKQLGFSRLEWHEETLFTTRSLGFPDDSQRQAVLRKWRKLRAEIQSVDP